MTPPNREEYYPKNTSVVLRLQALTGTREGYEAQLQANEQLIIGRDPKCGLVLSDRGVSRQHCRLSFVANRWQIDDLGSTNGVQLMRSSTVQNLELKSASAPLEHGDELEVGEAKLRVEISTVAEMQTDLLPPRQLDATTDLLVPNSPVARNPMHARETIAGVNAETSDKIGAPGIPEHFFSERRIDDSINEKLPYRFRNYRIEKKIGEGGMGEVYLASIDGERDRSELAIKFLRNQRSASAQDHARFVREMEISAQLKHSSIVDCLDCGEENGQPFIVMPYCSGGNLAELLKRTGKLNLRRAMRLLDRLLAGVEQAHGSGIVHRDLKPFNVLLAKDNQNKYIPKISDFGLAKSYLLAGESGMTVNGTVGGSWAYMPKEQLTNFRFVSPQSDVWSLGAIAYECLTLKLPRPMILGVDPIRIILDSKLVSIVEACPGLPNRVAHFIMKSLSPEVADRYKDAGQMRAALRTTASREGIEL